jgi:hypothetical protein
MQYAPGDGEPTSTPDNVVERVESRSDRGNSLGTSETAGLLMGKDSQ